MVRVVKTPDGEFVYDRKTGIAVIDPDNKTLTWEKPLYAQVAITRKCNMNPPCPFCYASASPKCNLAWSIRDLKHLVAAIDEWGLLGVSFSGGEPFTYPALANIVKWTKEKTGLDVSLTTNGLATQEQIMEVAPYIGEIRLSLYSPKSIPLIAKFIHKNFDFGINLLIRRGTVEENRKILFKAIKLGVRDVLINEFVKTGRGKNIDLTPTTEEYRRLTEIINSVNGKSTVKINTRLLMLLKAFDPNMKGKPFDDRKIGRIVAITVDKQVKLSSLEENGLPFHNPTEIPVLYQKLIATTSLDNHPGNPGKTS